MRDRPRTPRKKLQQGLHIRLVGAQAQKIRSCAPKQVLGIAQMRFKSLRVLSAQAVTGGIHPGLGAGFRICHTQHTDIRQVSLERIPAMYTNTIVLPRQYLQGRLVLIIQKIGQDKTYAPLFQGIVYKLQGAGNIRSATFRLSRQDFPDNSQDMRFAFLGRYKQLDLI